MQEQNIVQAEFFHVGGKDTKSLGHLFSQIEEKMADGLELALNGVESNPGIKTVIRFYDRGGLMTNFVWRVEKARTDKDRIRDNYDESKGQVAWWVRIRQGRKLTQAMSLLDRMKSQKLPTTLGVLRQAVSDSPIAVEIGGHRFRMARSDEVHELLEKAANAKGVWLFVFEPNDLLADKNEMVTSSMW